MDTPGRTNFFSVKGYLLFISRVSAWIFLFSFIFAQSGLSAPVISISVDTLKFGAISAGCSHNRQFKVSNTGDAPLVITSVEISGANFQKLYPSLPDTIMAGRWGYFRFKFSPNQEISYDHSAFFNSNDPEQPHKELPVRARGIRSFDPGDVIWSYQGIDDIVSCASMRDLDGDEFEDLAAESFDVGARGDNLLCLSGSSYENGTLLWATRPIGGDSISGGVGDQCLISINDLNNNGKQDIILGTAWSSRTIFAIDGGSGAIIWLYNTWQHQPHAWIYSVASMGDINGDNIPDILAGLGSDANEALCISGQNGNRLWRAPAGDAVYSVCRIDDVNDDNVADAVLGSGDNEDAVFCISGASSDTGRVIWHYESGGSVMSLSRISDLNHDAHNDVITGVSFGFNEVVAISGNSHDSATIIWHTTIGSPIAKVLACPDLDDDGLEDVLVASWSNEALALSGEDGSLLWSNSLGADVKSIYWSYDINDDGTTDVMAGAMNSTIKLIDGATGETLWNRSLEAPIFTLRPIRDVNGDSIPDVVAGEARENGVGGKIFILSGGGSGSSSVPDKDNRLPQDAILLSNYPNPFNSSTVISYELERSQAVRIEVFNLLGQKIRTLLDEKQNAGTHRITWNACDNYGSPVSTGLYLLRLGAGSTRSVRKLMILK